MRPLIPRTKRALTPLILAIAALMLAACGSDPEPPLPAVPAAIANITVEGGAFTAAGLIRARYTCDGVNISPHVGWTGVPPEAVTIALLLDDSDAPDGTYLHWIAYDVPPDVTEIPESLGTPQFKSLFGGL